MTHKLRIPHNQIVGVIPARWGSKRFPGKVLTPINNRPLLEWIVRGCRQSRRVRQWIVATDDKRIADVAVRIGVEVVMTPTRMPSGSDRVAFVMKRRHEQWVVNWQGDEWLRDGRLIDRLVGALEQDRKATVATLARPLSRNELADPNRVKVVLSQSGRALYFSRALIPHDISGTGPSFLHLGAYLFERQELMRFSAQRLTPLERRERLEQLRLLEYDVPIAVAVSRATSWGVDVPADARALNRMLSKSGR